MLILEFDMDLIVFQKFINKLKDVTSYTLIQNLINELRGKVIFWISHIQVSKVGTYTNAPFLLIERNGDGWTSVKGTKYIIPTLSNLYIPNLRANT